MADRYPDIPSYADGGAGHRGVDTSIAGAQAIQNSLPRLQKAVLGVIRQAGSRGATGDEIAQALGWERFRVRPRTSELRRDGRIVDSGARRESLSGIASIVWVAPSQIGGPDNA
jgi:biotin operon repressor